MNIDQYLVGKLAERMWRESATHPEAIAIGCALRNRVQDGLLSWHQVAMESAGETHREVTDPRDPEFLKCLWAAEDVYCGRQADIVAGAAWWIRLLRHGQVPAATVGTLRFYRTAS
ncbi:MAG TPA: hypothetical protein VHU83_06610 [Bryobacteraceae bacterium]|jgi:hypothetical protein|nr:hypothetical protein [Bryobacteraceae bacterium]